jgi:hypothetical protein
MQSKKAKTTFSITYLFFDKLKNKIRLPNTVITTS